MIKADQDSPSKVAAVILAAGRSQRMGRPKLTLPWGNSTVIGTIVDTLHEAAIEPLIVVTGAAHVEVARVLDRRGVQLVYNPRFEEDQMLLSLQAGMAALPIHTQAMLVCLGDQPQMQVQVIEQVILAYQAYQAKLVVPSYQMHRGHPWLIDRSLWAELSTLDPATTMREFLNTHADEIHYVTLDQASILQDLDTPDDYQKFAPQSFNLQ